MNGRYRSALFAYGNRYLVSSGRAPTVNGRCWQLRTFQGWAELESAPPNSGLQSDAPQAARLKPNVMQRQTDLRRLPSEFDRPSAQVNEHD